MAAAKDLCRWGRFRILSKRFFLPCKKELGARAKGVFILNLCVAYEMFFPFLDWHTGRVIGLIYGASFKIFIKNKNWYSAYFISVHK